MEKQRKTFLSYSRVNKDFAIKLAKELKAEGFDLWLDQLDIEPGRRWDDEVERALEECEIFMVIITPASSASDNVKDEIGYAIDSKKRILPILLENATLPLRLRRLQYVDFTSKGFNEGVESAKELLKKLIAQPTIQRADMSDKQHEQVSQVIRESKADVEEESKAQKDREAKAEVDRLATQKAEEERSAREKAEIDRRIKEEAERLFAQRTEEERLAKAKAREERAARAKAKEEGDRLAAQKVEAERLAKQKAAEEMAAKAEAERLATQKAESDKVAKQKEEDERIAKARAETERKAKAEAEIKEKQDREAKAEADRVAKQKAEEERLAKARVEREAKSEAERKAKEETDRLAAQKAEVDRAAKQKAEDERLTKTKTERKVKEETNQIPIQAPRWSAVAWITLGSIIGFLVIANNLRNYVFYRGYTDFTDTMTGAIGGAVIGLALAITLKRQHTIYNWKNVLWITLLGTITFSIAVVKGEQAYNFITSGAIYGALGWFGIALVLRSIHIISNWKSMVWITLFGAIGLVAGLETTRTIIFGLGSNFFIGGIFGGIIFAAISAFVLIWQIRKSVNNNLSAESAMQQPGIASSVAERPATDNNTQSKIGMWLQVWWKRGLIVTIVMAVVGFLSQYLETNYVSSYSILPITVISIIVGLFGFMFYPHKISYILIAVLGVIGIFIWTSTLYTPFSASLWLGLGSGFILSAIISRILHAMKKI